METKLKLAGSIARRIIEDDHGGEIFASAHEPVGAVVGFILPLAE